MKATKLYAQLEKDFINPGLSDEWAKYMDSVADFLSENFKKRSMGLVCDFAEEINRVYTAVFPSKKVMKEILDKGTQDAMLFVHHPSIWDVRKDPAFYQMDRKLLEKFRENRISIYNLHVPLDNYGPYSTGVSLAKALGIKPKKAFAHYFGSLSGVIGETKCKTIEELKKKFEEAIGHRTELYNYGASEIKDGLVSVIPGGGNDIDLLKEVAKEGVNLHITGISIKNKYSQKAHDFAKQEGISILGGTHYSTEKFACMEMCKYFKKLNLLCKFIADKPVMADM